MLARLRSIYNAFIMPLGRASVALKLTADFWTLFSIFAALLGGVFLYQGEFWWGLALIIVMFAADAMDGATARAQGNLSKFGTIFDHVMDRYAEFIVIASLVMGTWISPFTGFFACSGIIMASYVRAKAESVGGLKDCTVGIAGRAEKLILTYLAVIFLGLGLAQAATISLLLVGFISHLTAFQRLFYARAVIQSQSQSGAGGV